MFRRTGTPVGAGRFAAGTILGLVAFVALVAVLARGAVGAAASEPASPAPLPRLAFVKAGRTGDQVWIADVNGTSARHLGPGDVPLVSPSGALVVAGLSGSRSAAVLYGPGTSVHRFFKASRVGVQALAWSPDSRYVAIELFGNNPGKHDRDSGLAIVDTQSFTSRVIVRGSICGASFSPAMPDRLLYGLGPAGSFCLSGRLNVFASSPDGSGRKQITTDGRSLNPVWGPTKIAFDHERPRRRDVPTYQVWLMNPDGSGRTQITHTKVPALLEGLVPVQFSADGGRLLAEYEGQDTSEAWTIDLATRRTRQVKIKGVGVTAGGLSSDGSTVLVDYNGFLNPPSAGTVETVPFGGGPVRVLVRHAGYPSWNR
jgi:hypothetical protein